MQLEQLLDEYAAKHPHGLADGTIAQLKCSISQFSRCFDRQVYTKDLSDDKVNSWVDSMRCRLAHDTIRTHRGRILALWRFAWLEGIVDQPPKRVRMPRRGRRTVVTWTREEVQQLVKTAESMPGRFRKLAVPRGLWAGALIRAKYDSGLRISDMLALRAMDIPQDEHTPLRIIQQKTDDEQFVYFRQSTLLAMNNLRRALPKGERLLFPLPWKDMGDFHDFIRALVASAGIRKGSSKFLRRSSATHIARDFGDEAAQRHLGHRSVETTRRAYIDRSQLGEQRPLPPELD